MSDLGVSLQFSLVDRLSGGMRNMHSSVGRVSRAFGEASKAVKQTDDNMARMTRSMETLQRRMQLAQNFAIVGQQVSRMGNQMLRPITNAVNVAADFEETMSAVGAVTQGTTEQMAALTRQARDLGSSTQFSAIQAAEGMKFLGMTGFETNEIVAAMPGLLAAAKAGSMDLARTADIASNMLSGFGLEAAEMNRVADVLVSTFTSANANTEQLGDTMKYVAPLARAAGMQIEEAAAMAGLLGDAGIQGSMAGTTLRGMLAKLSNPAGDAANLLDELNVELMDMDGNLRSPVTVLGELAAALENMGTGERLAALGTIFDDRAASGMAKLIEDEGAGGITKFVKALNEAEGAAFRVAQQMGDNARGSMIELASATEGLQIAFATLLLPTIRVLSGIMTGVTRAMSAFTEEHPRLAKVVGIAAGGLGVLAITIGGVLGVASAILGPFAMLSHAMILANIHGIALTAGFRAMGLAVMGVAKGALVAVLGALKSVALFMVTNPIGLTITAIATAAFLIVKYWSPIKNFFIGVWAAIQPGLQTVWGLIKGVFSFSPLGLIMKNWEPIIEFFTGMWEKIGGIFSRIGSALGFGGKEQSLSVTERPAALSASTPIEQTMAGARMQSYSRISAPITINAAPGQSPEQIAAAVSRELNARERRTAAQIRSRLYD